MSFNPNNDKIAITVPKFKLLKHVDGIFQKYNEPYLTSVAVDASGTANPKIDFSFMPFPKVAVSLNSWWSAESRTCICSA